MRIEETPGEHYRFTFDSPGELAHVAEKQLDNWLIRHPWGGENSWMSVSSREEHAKLGREGWDVEAAQALDIASQAVEKVEKEYEIETFQAVWDVAGCEVDVARFLANEPENMIDYEMAPVARNGRVITLCASVCYSGAISAETIKKRGHAIAALAFALNTLGYATELWADFTVKATQRANNMTLTTRVLVKGPNDALDPAMIMFAYAHPGMSRAMIMPSQHEMPQRLHPVFDLGGGHGKVRDPIKDLPEGTIYMPSLIGGYVPEAYEALVGYMKELGLIN